MPSQYSDSQKQQALEMLAISEDIAFVSESVGIPERTLRHWRQLQNEQPDCQIAEKNISSEAEDAQEPDGNSDDHSDHATADQPESAEYSDQENYAFIREKLKTCARQMAINLQPDAPDISRRTLALARILDRIERLDHVLQELSVEEERPVWQDAYDAFMACNPSAMTMLRARQAAENRDPQSQAKVYEWYVEQFQRDS